jgi:DNA-binding CsgD family transcriptional regulator
VPGWDAELLSAIQSCGSVAEAGSACRGVAHGLGFPHFLLGLRVVAAVDRPAQFIISGYPREWRIRYDARGYMAIDPVLGTALVRVLPFSWDELDQGAPPVRGFFEDAFAHGLCHGFTVPVHGAHGNFSLLSLARETPLPEDADELHRLYRYAHWFALHLHERLCGLVSHDGEFVVQTPRLSTRERECLSMAAQGYSAAAIGRLLKITERTAVFHLSHAMEKLGARSRQHAIALATQLGQLDMGTYPQQMERSQKLVEME